jgi:hypothetical protein
MNMAKSTSGDMEYQGEIEAEVGSADYKSLMDAFGSGKPIQYSDDHYTGLVKVIDLKTKAARIPARTVFTVLSFVQGMAEQCYFHKGVEAQVWRETFVFGEPPRVPLCCECAGEARKLRLLLYPLNEIHVDPPGFKMTGWFVGPSKII